jgi:hypothetical protein
MTTATYTPPAEMWAQFETQLARFYRDERAWWARDLIKRCPRDPWPNHCVMPKHNVRLRIINMRFADSTWGPCLASAQSCEVAS